MEIFSKVIFGIFVTVVVILSTAGFLFFSIMIEAKIILQRQKRLRENLSKEEMRLIELSSLVTKFSASVTDRIAQLVEMRQKQLDKICYCSSLQANKCQEEKKQE